MKLILIALVVFAAACVADPVEEVKAKLPVVGSTAAPVGPTGGTPVTGAPVVGTPRDSRFLAFGFGSPFYGGYGNGYGSRWGGYSGHYGYAGRHGGYGYGPWGY